MFEIGSTLREARERQGLLLADVEQATQIRTRYIVALEEERFDAIPARAYARGFLRVYADFLGLDARLYVDELNSRYPEGDQPEIAPPRARSSRAPEWLPRTPVLAAVAAVVALVVVLAWRAGSQPHTTAVPAPLPRVTQRHRVAAPVVSRVAHRPAAARAHLVLQARGRCWVSVRVGSATGAVLAERVLAPGEVLRYTLAADRPQLWLRIGAPWNLAVSLNGKSGRARLRAPGNVVVSRAGMRLA